MFFRKKERKKESELPQQGWMQQKSSILCPCESNLKYFYYTDKENVNGLQDR